MKSIIYLFILTWSLEKKIIPLLSLRSIATFNFWTFYFLSHNLSAGTLPDSHPRYSSIFLLFGQGITPRSFYCIYQDVLFGNRVRMETKCIGIPTFGVRLGWRFIWSYERQWQYKISLIHVRMSLNDKQLEQFDYFVTQDEALLNLE